jgi:hypothetical protein
MDAERFARQVRTHWSVENGKLWTPELTSANAIHECVAVIRRIESSLIKPDTASKRSLERRRKICGYDNEYLDRLLFNSDSVLAPRPPS